MADIDEYYEFLKGRNNQKQIKREQEEALKRQELERLQKEKEHSIQLQQWRSEYDNCVSVEDFRQYISKHNTDIDNPYLKEARARYTALLKPTYTTTSNSYSTSSSHSDGFTIKAQHIAAIAIVLIVGTFFVFLLNKKISTNRNICTSEEHVEKVLIEDERVNSRADVSVSNQISESDFEPAKKFIECPLCFRTGRCGVCGGGGVVYSVFDGDEIVPIRLIDCNNCGGSGACQLCEGTGWVEDFSW